MIEANKITKKDADYLIEYEVKEYKRSVMDKIDSVINHKKAKLAYNKSVYFYVWDSVPKKILESVLNEYKEAGWYFILYPTFIPSAGMYHLKISKAPFFWHRVLTSVKKLLHFK